MFETTLFICHILGGQWFYNCSITARKNKRTYFAKWSWETILCLPTNSICSSTCWTQQVSGKKTNCMNLSNIFSKLVCYTVVIHKELFQFPNNSWHLTITSYHCLVQRYQVILFLLLNKLLLIDFGSLESFIFVRCPYHSS